MNPAPALALALALVAVRAVADDTPAPVRRLAVVAGASDGGKGRTPLHYARSDAREVARLLRQLGGVAAEDLVLLEDPDAATLRGTLRRTAADAARMREGGRRLELFLYYSGHSDEDGLLLGSTRLSYADLRHDLDEIPVAVRVAILDSCASGAFTRAKGGVQRAPFMVDASNRVTGHAFLTSSAADEASQESDTIGASFFTHALLTGLRGAADSSADGVVTLNEAYQYAFRETLARTETTRSGPQHATYDIGLVGSGDVVITDLRRADAVLVLPEAMSGRVFLRNGAGALVAELRKQPAEKLELALEPGGYAVRLQREGRVMEGAVAVGAGQHVQLEEAKLALVRLEPTTARGAGLDGAELAALPAVPSAPGAAVAPPPAPAPRGMRGRQAVRLTIGATRIGAQTSSSGDTTAQSSAAVDLLATMGYAYWVGEHAALTASTGIRSAQGEETTAASTTTNKGAAIVSFLLGGKLGSQLGPGSHVFVCGVLEAGALMGASSVETKTGSGTSQSSGRAETKPALRLGAGVDWFPLRHLVVGLEAGYLAAQRFDQPVAGRRDYSGFDAGVSAGFAWGGH